MDEIKVGEFVRTKDGIIAKVTDVLREYSIDCDDDVFDIENGPMMEIPWEYIEEYIVNHSFNLKELIEVGDIIEWEWKEFGYYGINEVINRFRTIGVYPEEYDEVVSLKDIKIKSILTHEQYERNCYKVEEEQ